MNLFIDSSAANSLLFAASVTPNLGVLGCFFCKGLLKTTTLHYVAGHLFGSVSCERITFSAFAVILLEGLGFPLTNLCG